MPAKRNRDGVTVDGGASSDEGLQLFRKVLQELKTTAQSKIKQLTALAETHKGSVAELSHVLAEEITGAQASRLQPLFSVLDSIMKKLGKEYRTHLIEVLPELVKSAHAKADANQRIFLGRILNESWRKHELIPPECLAQLDVIFAGGGLPAPGIAQVKMEVQPSQPSSSFVAVKDEAFAAAAAGRQLPASATPPPPQVPLVTGQPLQPPRVKGPPPKPPVKLETQAKVAAPAAASAETNDPELLDRRLMILTKIMERKGPTQEELKEIMRVPEIMKAMTMQRQGIKGEAMTLLAEYKAQLERAVETIKAARQAGDPRQAGKPMDPRAVDPRQAADPRQRAAPEAEVKPQDPRQAARLADPNQAETSSGKRAAEAADPRQKPAKVAKMVKKAAGASADFVVLDSDDEGGGDDVEVVPEEQVRKQVLQGLPSLGFSEGWLRQFLEQMPVGGSGPAEVGGARKKESSVGRKVLGAEGEQMVYVDELAPSEVLHLMQLVFLLEEKLRLSGGALDNNHRIPHTFSYLQVEPAIDVMLKRFFDEVPHQCTTTGLRFASREKLRKHHDALYRRRAVQQQRQRGAEARGWMETIPEWVGNRDLVVGPALFHLGGGAAIDEANAQRAQRASALEDAFSDEEEEEGSERSRWICPLDERRSVCPISGEPFEREWSYALNDWAFCDVVAVELGTTDQVLRFPPKNPKDPERLSESAFIFKKSCFLNTSPAQRLAALEDCRTAHSLGQLDDKPKAAVKPTSEMAKEAELLAAVFAETAGAPRRKFF